jgi:hypothetical protein
MQRDQQNKIMDEMFSPISNAILPASIEERLEFYKHRMKLDDQDVKYKITKQKFLNYRQLSSRLIKGKHDVIPSYALFYSTLARKKTTAKLDFSYNDIFYLNRDEIKLIHLSTFNKIAKTSYKSVYNLLYNPPNYEKEIGIRKSILEHTELVDLSPIVVIDDHTDVKNSKFVLELDALTYEDTKEKLIKEI